MIRNYESYCQSVSLLRRDYKKMANHFSFLKSSPVCNTEDAIYVNYQKQWVLSYCSVMCLPSVMRCVAPNTAIMTIKRQAAERLTGSG